MYAQAEDGRVLTGQRQACDLLSPHLHAQSSEFLTSLALHKRGKDHFPALLVCRVWQCVFTWRSGVSAISVRHLPGVTFSDFHPFCKNLPNSLSHLT